jgi:hypothetical protein
MPFLSKILGDNHQLKGPDISKALTSGIDLSGTKLCLPTPKKTLMIPTDIQQTSFDVLNDDLFYKWERDENSMSLDLHRNGWEFKGKLGHSIGCICLDVQLIRIASQTLSRSFFNINNLKSWLLHYSDESWGQSNRSKNEEHSGKAPKKYLWTYPLSDDHLLKAGLKEEGFYFYTSRPLEGVTTSYWVPISAQHILLFKFVSSPLDCDFYSPEHNLPEATEQFIKAFMQNVNITLSPEALAQKLTSGKNLLSSQESKIGS